MTQKSPPNRIAAEELADFKTWHLPLINDNGTVLPSAEKEARQRQEDLLKRSGESIEDVDLPQGVSKKGMTAKEMQEIFDEAAKDGYDQGHKEGFEKGQSEGYEAGQQKGLMEMRQQLVAEQQRFVKLAQSLLQPLAEQDDDIEQMLLDVICTLTQSVVQRELAIDSSHIVTLVKAAVEALPIGSKNLRVCLNPADLAAVEAYAQKQQLDWNFFSDSELSAGGCRIETLESRVDFSVSKRLQNLLEQFLSKQLTSAEETQQADDYPANDYSTSESSTNDYSAKGQSNPADAGLQTYQAPVNDFSSSTDDQNYHGR